jgi:hypothetical protein
MKPKKFKIQGEWWLLPHGELIFADGDIGESNHSGIVLQEIKTIAIAAFNLEANEEPILENEITELIPEIEKAGESQAIAKIAEVLDSLHPGRLLSQNTKTAEELIQIIHNPYGSKTPDPREIAIDRWGWIRIHENHAEIPNMRTETLNRLQNALLEILHETYQDDSGEEPETLEKQFLRTSFSIYSVRSQHTYKVQIRELTRWNLSRKIGNRIENLAESLRNAGKRAIETLDAKNAPEFYGNTAR